QAFDRFIVPYQSEVAHALGPEARIDKVENGVLHAANVLINRKPISDSLAGERRFVVVRIGVAVEVPRRVDKSVHGIGLTSRRAATLGTDSIHDLRHATKW